MSDTVRLLIGGVFHDAWERYRLDSDLLCPADDWSVTAAPGLKNGRALQLPATVAEGAEARLMLGDDLILDGFVDDIDEDIAKRGHYIELYGRDRGGMLVDCSAPLLSLQQATLEQIVRKAVVTVGIKSVKYTATPAAPRQRVHTEPGQSIWDWLQAACEANQVWPWFAPDGTLIIGAPDYKSAPVADLVLRVGSDASNVVSIRRMRSLRSSFSEVTVLGQSTGIDGEVGQHDIKGVAKDDTVPRYRPHVVIDGNCENAALATRRANKIQADGRMHRDRLTIVVPGHRITAGSGTGKPWSPGVRVNVLSEPHGIEAVYFLIKRTFIKSRHEHHTELHCIPDGSWTLNTPFIKAKHRASYGTRKGHYQGSGDDASE
jgi:prophage tail gpP-like protein